MDLKAVRSDVDDLVGDWRTLPRARSKKHAGHKENRQLSVHETASMSASGFGRLEKKPLNPDKSRSPK
jgi:hypothetical protein